MLVAVCEFETLPVSLIMNHCPRLLKPEGKCLILLPVLHPKSVNDLFLQRVVSRVSFDIELPCIMLLHCTVVQIKG